MGLITDAIRKHIDNKKENKYLEGTIESMADSYSSVEIKLTQMGENFIKLYDTRRKNEKLERLSIEKTILRYLHDLDWIYNFFLKRFESFEELYKKIYSKTNLTKSNQLKITEALNYKKEIRKHMEQLYSSFKHKGKNVEDVDYKKILNKMLKTFELTPKKDENTIYNLY